MSTVRFFSTPGIELVADLYLPSGQAPAGGYPAIVACLGWGSVKELMRTWGEALAGRGYAVLVPDYRGFGASDGERGRCFPEEHVDDIRGAVTFLTERGEVDSDRIALLGVSYGGAIAVTAGGLDDRPGAVISVVGYGSGERHLRAVRTPSEWEQFRARLHGDRRTRVLQGRSQEIDPDEILMRDAEARAWRDRVEREFPHMAFRTTLESAQKMIDFVPERHLPYPSHTPVLFIHAGADRMVPVEESRSMWQRAGEPKELIVIPDIGHHEVHSGEPFERTIRHIDEWLIAHMTTSP